MRLLLSLCLIIKASIVIADESCLAYAPDDTWPETNIAVAGSGWLSLSAPMLQLELGMTPVEVCQQLDEFVPDTAELESADPHFPAVEQEYADVVGPFIGMFAPHKMHFRGEVAWFEDPDIARPTTLASSVFSAPPSGSQMISTQTRYIFTNGSGRLPTMSEALDPILTYLGPYSRKNPPGESGRTTYEWLIQNGSLIETDTPAACSLKTTVGRFQSFDSADAVTDSCDGWVMVTVDETRDVPGFARQMFFSIEDRARTRDTWRIDARVAQTRSDEISMYVNSPDGELNIRSGPSVDDAVWYVVENGDRVWVGETVGNWSYIKASQGRGGWVYASLLGRQP